MASNVFKIRKSLCLFISTDRLNETDDGQNKEEEQGGVLSTRGLKSKDQDLRNVS